MKICWCLILAIILQGCGPLLRKEYYASIDDEFKVIQFDGSTIVILRESTPTQTSPQIIIGSKVVRYARSSHYILGENVFSDSSTNWKTPMAKCGFFIVDMKSGATHFGLSQEAFNHLLSELSLSVPTQWEYTDR